MVVELLKRLGYTSVNSFYANRLSLLRYPEDLLRVMREKGLAYTKARVLARVKDAEVRRSLIDEAVRGSLSVEEVEQRVRVQTEGARAAPELYEDFSRVKRCVTKRSVKQLDAARQKRLRHLVREIEKLFDNVEQRRIT